MTEGTAGRNIPSAVMREVRQKSGFGCIFCGVPVFHYDHLIDFAVVGEHDPANLNLLCPTHHQLKTNGIISRSAIAKKALNPANKSKDRSSTGLPLEMSSSQMIFDIGTNVYVMSDPGNNDSFEAIRISDQPMVAAAWEDGWLKVSMRLTDECGVTLVEVVDGELFANTRLWDFELIGQKLTIRSGMRKISTRIAFGDGSISVDKGLFVKGKRAIQVSPESVNLGSMEPLRALGIAPSFLPGSEISRSTSRAFKVGLQYG